MNVWDAIELTGIGRNGPPDEGDLMLSLAISAKRIADALASIDRTIKHNSHAGSFLVTPRR